MQRVVWIVGFVVLASAVGGFLATRGDSGAVSPSSQPGAGTSAPATVFGDDRGSLVVPRSTRELRSDDAGHDHGHGHDDGDGHEPGATVPCRVLAQVHDEFGRAVAATVTLWSDAKEIGRAQTDADGFATVELEAAPTRLLLCVRADGYVDVEQEILRSADEALIDQLVILQSIDVARITGVVVDESGRPLDSAWLGLLGPAGERDPAYLAMAIGLTSAPRIVAHTIGGGRFADTLVTDLDPITGAFELEVPARFDGEVAFVFGERALALERWRAGDGPVLLTVPRERRLEATGTIEIDVVDEAGSPVRPCDLEILPDRFAFADEPLTRAVDVGLDDPAAPLVIESVPAVAMIVRARPADPSLCGAARAVVVEGGRTTRVRLVVAHAAAVKLWFVPERETMAMSGPSDLRCILPSGYDAPVLVDDAYDGERIGAQIDGIPPGDVAFEHDGNVLLVHLNAGQNPDQVWRIAALEAFTVRFAPAAPRSARGLDALRVAIDVRTESNYPILRAIETPDWIDESSAEFVEWLAPGRYRLEIDPGDGNPVAREFVLFAGADDTTVDFR